MFKSDNATNILIGKAVARTVSPTLANIAIGEVIVLGHNDVPLTQATATYAQNKTIRLAMKSNDGTIKFSPRIDGQFVSNYKGQAYAAQAFESKTITFSALPAATANQFVTVRVQIKDTTVFSSCPITKPFTVDATGLASVTDLAVAVKNAMNLDPFISTYFNPVTNAAGVVTITAKAQYWKLGDFRNDITNFNITVGGYSTAAVATVTAGSHGIGGGRHVAELEWFSNGFEGAQNRHMWPVADGFKDADSAGSYRMITVEFANVGDRTNVISGAKPSRSTLVLAFAGGAGANAQLNTAATATLPTILGGAGAGDEGVLNLWMASTPGGFAFINGI